MLFDFADDPLKADAGKGTIRVRGGGGGQVRKDAVTFVLLRADQEGRTIRVASDDAGNRARRAEIRFPPGGAYGLMLDRPSLNSRVFTAEPTVPAGHDREKPK
jgi:hypothetical protein